MVVHLKTWSDQFHTVAWTQSIGCRSVAAQECERPWHFDETWVVTIDDHQGQTWNSSKLFSWPRLSPSSSLYDLFRANERDVGVKQFPSRLGHTWNVKQQTWPFKTTASQLPFKHNFSQYHSSRVVVLSADQVVCSTAPYASCTCKKWDLHNLLSNSTMCFRQFWHINDQYMTSTQGKLPHAAL